jgi:hypothetical protein
LSTGAQVLPEHDAVDLAGARLAVAELVGQLAPAQLAGARREHVEQDLVAGAGEPSHHAFEGAAADHEESAHRIAERRLEHEAAEPGGETAHRGAALVPLAHAGAGRVPAPDHDVGRVRLEQLEHGGQQAFVVLQVAVDDREVGAARARKPSITAEDRPRRPRRWMQRTCGRSRARDLTSSAVPSGESSSTKITSHAWLGSTASSPSRSASTLSRSLKVGTITDSRGEGPGAGRPAGPGEGRMADGDC